MLRTGRTDGLGFGTFSIVGADPKTGEVGVAVASKFLAVGYDYACVLALSGSPRAALHHLKRALELDPTLARLAKEDPDLASLRNNPEFQSLITR